MLAEKTYTDFRPADIRKRVKYVVELSSIAIIYVAVAKLSLALASIHPSATPIWPPTGFALAIVLLLGISNLPRDFAWGLHCQRHNCGVYQYVARNCYRQCTRELSRRLSH